MAQIEKKIEDLIMPHLSDMGFELVRVLITGAGKYKALQIMVEHKDHETPVGLKDCEEISIRVSALLDVEDMIKGRYHLEVSSPGLNRPLIKEEDFVRFQGKKAAIETEKAIDTHKRFKGTIEKVENKTVLLKDGETVYQIPLSIITKANLVFEDTKQEKKGKKK